MSKIISFAYLKTLAEYYLLRWPASTAKLQQYLERRIVIAEEKGRVFIEDRKTLVAEVLQQLKKEGVLDDSVYAASLLKKFKARGYGAMKCRQALQTKGIMREDITAVMTENSVDEQTAACFYVRKRKLGQYRGAEKAREYFSKDLGALARQGFSFAAAKKALGEGTEEIEEMLRGVE